MTALYRKYRPLDFTQVVGQEAVVRTLRNALEHDQVRQAYLFAGPRGTGKTSMARILAKALNAEGGPTPDFDASTRIARAIADGTSLDVIEMDAASQFGHRPVRCAMAAKITGGEGPAAARAFGFERNGFLSAAN